MSDEFKGIEEMDLGIQDDGEPVVIVGAQPEPPIAEPTPEEEAKPEGEAKPEEEPPEQPHKKTGSQRARERADREAALRVQAERERDELKEMLAASSKPPVVDADEPQLESFDDFNAWKAALAKHHQAKAVSQAEAKFRADQLEREHQTALAKSKALDAKFAAEYPDFEDAIEDAREVVETFNERNAPGYPALNIAVSESEDAPALKYYLGKHPEELRRLSAMTPIQAVKGLALIEAKLSEPPTPKPTSKAPAPVRPVSGGSAVVADTKYGGIEEF